MLKEGQCVGLEDRGSSIQAEIDIRVYWPEVAFYATDLLLEHLVPETSLELALPH